MSMANVRGWLPAVFGEMGEGRCHLVVMTDIYSRTAEKHGQNSGTFTSLGTELAAVVLRYNNFVGMVA